MNGYRPSLLFLTLLALIAWFVWAGIAAPVLPDVPECVPVHTYYTANSVQVECRDGTLRTTWERTK